MTYFVHFLVVSGMRASPSPVPPSWSVSEVLGTVLVSDDEKNFWRLTVVMVAQP